MAISANELRIGNYVNYKNPDYENIPRIIDYIAKPNLVGLERVSVNHIPYSQIEPIPLTEEWLLKFGFEWSIFHQAHHKDGFNYDITILHNGGVELTTWKRGLILQKLKHVHQLQNLYFALTNQELTIKE